MSEPNRLVEAADQMDWHADKAESFGASPSATAHWRAEAKVLRAIAAQQQDDPAITYRHSVERVTDAGYALADVIMDNEWYGSSNGGGVE